VSTKNDPRRTPYNSGQTRERIALPRSSNQNRTELKVAITVHLEGGGSEVIHTDRERFAITRKELARKRILATGGMQEATLLVIGLSLLGLAGFEVS
jgi:hypothetical protein